MNTYTKTGNKIVQVREYPGILKAEYQHEIKETKGGFNYIGPKIPPQEWQQVLAFFKWTYDKTKSESQVRGYINPESGEVRFWAFPQHAGMGMTAKEIDTVEARAAATAMFPTPPWQYFLTVHHHCSASAFQSGVDAANEETIDGLHLTVGHIDQEKHSLHSRFYLCKDKFTPDLSEFWDIGDEARQAIPPTLWSDVAQYQMSLTDPGVNFPEQWKENVIEMKSAVYTSPAVITGYSYKYKPWGQEACEDILEAMERQNITHEEFSEFLLECNQNELFLILVDAIRKNHCDLDDIIKHWPDEQELVQAELAQQTSANTQAPAKVEDDEDAAWRGYYGQ